MASLRVLAFDHEGIPIQFDTWLDDLQLYLLSDSKDSVSLFDLASGAATAPPAIADSPTRSQWLTRDAAARLAIRNHLPLAKCTHFGQHRTAQAMYGAEVARYSSPATAALGRLLLPYLFPELSAFAMVEDLVSHLHTSDARYRATVPAEFHDRNPPPMFITLYFIVTRLPNSLRSVRDHFLSLDPTSLTIDLLEEHLLAAETSAVAVGAARGTPRMPFFEGCSPSPLAPSYASAAAADVPEAAIVGAASASAKRHNGKGKGGRGVGGGSGGGGGGSGGGGGGSGGGGSGGSGGRSGGFGGGGGGSGGSGGSGSGGSGGGRIGAQRGGSGGGQRQQQQRWSETPSPQQLRDRAGQTWGKLHTQHCCFSRLNDAWRAEFGDEAERPRWTEVLRSGVAIFDLDYDAILAAMYALSVSAEGDCYLCIPPDSGIEAAALGASESVLPGTAPAEALHTFTLDSGASRCFFRDSTTLQGPDPRPFLHCAPVSGGVSITSGCNPCSCRLLTHQTLLWHHRLGHPSLPRLRGMHSRLLVSSLPRSLPPLPLSPAPPCLPCVEGRQRAAPHSSSFPPRLLPCRLSTWTKGQVVDVLIPWIRNVHLQLRERFRTDFPVLRLHSDRGGEFSSDLLRDFCGGEGIVQSFTLSDSPQQNGIAERRIGLVMEVARTSMIHAAAPHFLWLFAVRYAAHQLKLWPRVSLPKTSPTLRWTGKVGDMSVFRVWGSRAFVRDTSADKLSARSIPCVFLSFSLDAPSRQFYHPTSRRVFPSQDVTFDESVPFYRLFPYRSAPPPPPPLFLAPGPPPVAVGSGAARGAASGGAEAVGAELGGAESEGARSGGAEPGLRSLLVPGLGVLSLGVRSLGGLSVREWSLGVLGLGHTRLQSGATGPRDSAAGDTRAGGAGVTTGTGGTGGAATAGPGGARTGGTGAAGAGGVGGAGAGDHTESGAAGAGGAGAVDPGAGGAGAGGARAVDPGAGGAGCTVRPRPYFVPLVQQPASPLPAPSPYTEQTGGLTERHEPTSRPASPVRTGPRVPCPRPPPVPGTHAMTLRPSSVPLRVPLPPPPESSLPAVPVPESDRARAACPTFSRLLATVVSDPSFESTAASALVAELVDFAAACRLDYVTSLVAESDSARPSSVGGECALGRDVLEDRQEEFECLATSVPRFASMMLAPEGDPNAPDIPTPRSYAEAITGPYSSQWQAAMDAEMASWKSTGTYVDAVPPSRANIVDGMWILRVNRPPGSPPAFKARYVARGFRQR
ncbi:unnamed protein product [Closterium sp. NIES-54]